MICDGAGRSAGVTTALGVASSVNQNGALVSTTGTDATRTSLQNDFNDIISQIDSLANDTSYNGVNLLHGDNLKVVFNDTAMPAVVTPICSKRPARSISSCADTFRPGTERPLSTTSGGSLRPISAQ